MGPDQPIKTKDVQERTAQQECDNIEDLKKEINNLIWMYAPATINIGEAEDIACNVLDMIKNGKAKPE